MISHDLRNDEGLIFDKMHAASGVRSIAVPLIVADKATGVLALYTRHLEYFDAGGLKLLTELAGNLAFAIGHIEKQERLELRLLHCDEMQGYLFGRLVPVVADFERMYLACVPAGPETYQKVG